ncbi:flavin reductase family protein [Frankia gtarii]|uniref:flavin reductase family protein n=1 Tax=Frankia gtarii TaxID=2950102 RepID=UPI0021BF0404|nr:flavin reductase family protein [Frankia gtarii]
MIESHPLRQVLAKFLTGVTVVTTNGPDGAVGVTVNSFASVSLDPALVLVCLKQTSGVGVEFAEAKCFAVNILSEHQELVSRKLSRSTEKFLDEVSYRHGDTGAPLLTEALAYVDCELYERIDAGDHVIVIGRVRDFKVQRDDARPLVFYGGRYLNLSFSG